MSFWIWLKNPDNSNVIQAAIAIIYLFTLIVLWCNLNKLDTQIKETRRQADAAQKQLGLTQILNQPLCAVSLLKVDKPRYNVVQISPIIKNFGKMVERDASFEWRIDIIENINDAQKRKERPVVPWRKKAHIKIIPEQEFMGGFRQFNTKDFNDMVRGYDSAVQVSMIIGYHDAEDKPQQYSCSYIITRLADIKKDQYEVMLVEAN